MAGIGIPGVSDKYKTNELVENLMKVERIPLTREQNSLEAYKTQQNAWRDVNQKMTALRDSVKSLYSFDNPFNNKLATSTDEAAVSAEAGRDAAFTSFKIDVIAPASSDKLLSGEIKSGEQVAQGTYIFKAGNSTVNLKWRGGKIEDFISSLNRRGEGVIKASLIGVNRGNKSMMIESLKTGEENRLVFEGDALAFALDKGFVKPPENNETALGTRSEEILPPSPSNENLQAGMPELSAASVGASENGISFPPRSGARIEIPQNDETPLARIEFSVSAEQVPDIAEKINAERPKVEIAEAGSVSLSSASVENDASQTGNEAARIDELIPIRDEAVLFAIYADGTEEEIPLDKAVWNFEGNKAMSLDLRDKEGISAISVKNRNTDVQLNFTPIKIVAVSSEAGYEPARPVSLASDAVIKYEGITISRPTNSIDDVVPGVTLKINNKTDRTATISISPDTESAKDALITFVGNYNQMFAELNVLSQNKPEIISELDYLSSAEREEYERKLGLFFNDFSLGQVRNSLQQIVSNQYNFSDSSDLTMLSQIGISTNATNYTGYNPSKMRGYLEINEKQLDESLRDNLDDIKRLFGFDSDGDLIIDSGIGYMMDRQLTSYVQSGGILSTKTRQLDRQIDTSEKNISRLETQINAKEAELRQKYGQMESTLNSLEKQQSAIDNFARQNRQQ